MQQGFLSSEPYSIARETGKRVLGMRHFDEQLIGGIVLHRAAKNAPGSGQQG